MGCRYGFQVDAKGCPMCACRPEPCENYVRQRSFFSSSYSFHLLVCLLYCTVMTLSILDILNLDLYVLDIFVLDCTFYIAVYFYINIAHHDFKMDICGPARHLNRPSLTLTLHVFDMSLTVNVLDTGCSTDIDSQSWVVMVFLAIGLYCLEFLPLSLCNVQTLQVCKVGLKMHSISFFLFYPPFSHVPPTLPLLCFHYQLQFMSYLHFVSCTVTLSVFIQTMFYFQWILFELDQSTNTFQQCPSGTKCKVMGDVDKCDGIVCSNLYPACIGRFPVVFFSTLHLAISNIPGVMLLIQGAWGIIQVFSPHTCCCRCQDWMPFGSLSHAVPLR